VDAIIESIRDTEPRRLSWGILFLYSNIRFIAFIFVSCWMLDDNELPSDNPTLQVQFPLHTSKITVDIAIFRGALYLYLLGVKLGFNSHQMVLTNGLTQVLSVPLGKTTPACVLCYIQSSKAILSTQHLPSTLL
jgi:hypothetical protein